MTKKDKYIMFVKKTKGGVVHAAAKQTRGAYTSYTRRYSVHTGQVIDSEKTKVPSHEVVRIACSWRDLEVEAIIETVGPITCKRCLMALGYIEPVISSERFVLYNKQTKTYYKKSYPCNDRWVDDINAATLYKVKPAAVSAGKCLHCYDSKGNRISYTEYRDKHKSWATKRHLPSVLREEHFICKSESKFDDERYEVRNVFITVRE